MSGTCAHRWGNERKMHRNHPKNKVTNFPASQTALLHANTSVFVYLYGKEIWTKISTTYQKRKKGWTGTVNKFHMVGDEQSSWDLSFSYRKFEFSSRKLAFADQHELNQRIHVTLPRRDSMFGLSTLVFLPPGTEVILKAGEVFPGWVAGAGVAWSGSVALATSAGWRQGCRYRQLSCRGMA